jgi:UDP-N-acetylglucosamine 2-epimerase (non-hydrolysing)
MKKTLIVVGTRPEAIKLAPLILALQKDTRFTTRVCLSGQHADLISPIFDFFGITADYDLAIMRPNQQLSDITSKLLTDLMPILDDFCPDFVIVQGDTSTAFSAALAAFYRKIPVLHVEAGLRSPVAMSPFPEEMNRRLISQLASLHFCPTEAAKVNLIAQGISEDACIVTGNTAIDALLMAKSQLESVYPFKFLPDWSKMILVTVHRRDSFGEGILSICDAILDISRLYPDIHIVFPLHPNPNVGSIVRSRLGGINSIHLIPPQDYPSFVYLMMRSVLILTDSGGIQEEAPSLNRPVIVLREVTERQEVIDCGAAVLAGFDSKKIVEYVSMLLTDHDTYLKMSTVTNPYGDGMATLKIIDTLSTTERIFQSLP